MAADAEASPAANTTSQVHVVDTPETRVRRFADVLAMLGAGIGVVLVLLFGAYANGTTEGITDDVRGISDIIQRLLVAPVNLFSGLVTLVLPAVIITSLAIRREPRRILEVLAAAVAAFIVTAITAYLVVEFGIPALQASLSVSNASGVAVLQLPAYIAGVAAMLTTAGRRGTRRYLAVSWNVLWIALVVGVVSGIVTVAAALLTVFIGRLCGLAMRYAFGSTADRAYGDQLVEAIERAGFRPKRVLRIDPANPATLENKDPAAVALGRTRMGRVYDVKTRENHHLIVVALDGDQQVAGLFTKLWSSLRLRGISARADVSLRHSAEATALASHAARTAGVRTSRILGMSHVRDTMVLVYQRPTAARTFADSADEDLTDEVLDTVWSEIERAHAAAITHRALSSDTILVGIDDLSGEPIVWITTWEFGEVASSTLAQRIDRAQVLAMMAARVGPHRAVDSAFRVLGQEAVEYFAPMLQSIAMPRSTRHEIRTSRHAKVLQELRSEILARLPEADVERENITRFGARTVLTLVLGIVAAVIILAGFNTQQVIDALQEANAWWLLTALGWALLTFFGAALAMLAFSPIRLPWNRVLLVQVAAAYVALVAPAGVGPAALNLRMLTKRGVQTPLAVATVALVQVSAVVVTLVGLVGLTVLTGSEGTLAALPSTSVLIGVGVTAGVVALALTVPRVRMWAGSRVLPVVRQTWPRLAQVVGQPWRIVLGIGGNLILTVGYVGAFHATLEAFGQDLAVIDVAVLFFLGNAVGAIVPTPGGLGAVEFALVTGLTGAGLPVAVATSVVVVYRAITYWARIPMGYVALKYLQRKSEL